MWAPDMDRRVYRVGQRPYNRGNFVPSTVPRQVDERLHTRGLSTSSNSSWTFSNSPADFPKQRRGGFCGAVLIAAVFVVVAAVLCVGALAFYMGAKRVEASNMYLVIDGVLRITYGDQFRDDLKDASSNMYLEKAQKYQHLLTMVLQKTALQAALKEVTILRFINGTSLLVGFRLHLDRRKLPTEVDVLDIIRRALQDEFASVKPVAFRNMAVELQSLTAVNNNNGADEESYHESTYLERGDSEKKTEIKNGVIRKVQSSTTSPVVSKPKPVLSPIMGTSVKMAELGETIKLRNEAKLAEDKAKNEVKSVEFRGKDEEIEVVKELVQELEITQTHAPETTESSSLKYSTLKPSKVYQSVYITSDNVRITNATNGEAPKESTKIQKPDLIDYKTPQPQLGSGSYAITRTEPDALITQGGQFQKTAIEKIKSGEKAQSHKPPSGLDTPAKETNPANIVRATTWSPNVNVNGHARPLTPAPVNVAFALADNDEPWRPIIPTRRPTSPPTTPEPYIEQIDSLIEESKGLSLDENDEPADIPITFSQKVYEENIKVAPEFAEKHKTNIKNTKLSKITEDIAKKYKDMLKQQSNHKDSTEKPTVTQKANIETSTESSSPTVIVNPFKEDDNSRASSIVKFGLPELPILQQIHHLDSLLKSFAGGTASGGSSVLPVSGANKIASTTIPYDSVAAKTIQDSVPNPSHSIPQYNLKTTAASTTKIATTSTTSTTTKSTTTTKATKTKTTTTPTPSTATTTTAPKTTHISETVTSSVSTPTEYLATRFPARRRYTTVSDNETQYVEVSTFSPEKRYKTEPSTSIFMRNTTGRESDYTNTIHPDKHKYTTSTAITTIATSAASLLNADTLSTPQVTMLPLSTRSATTRSPPATSSQSVPAEVRIKDKHDAYVVKGEVEVLDQTTAEGGSTTEISRLITLLPVRSNVNMNSPLRPRPSIRRGRFHTIPPHSFIDDESGKRWVYYSSSKMTQTPEKLFIVTPEPKNIEKPSDLPILNAIEQLLSTDYRDRSAEPTKNSSEIVDRIVKIMDNVAISADNSPEVVVKINSTIISKSVNTTPKTSLIKGENVSPGISTKAVSSGGVNYKLNQAGVPILTKVLQKDPGSNKKDLLNEKFSSHIHPTECGNNSVRCSNGVCLPPSSRCNQLVDCPDAADEKNCTCAEHLQAQRLNRKLCDGVVDCWDFSDEYNCDWCKPKQYLCSNSRTCIDQEYVCDGKTQCPHGDDEKSCVTVAPSVSSWGSQYHSSGYLMVRKEGHWGKLCVDNFDEVSEASQTGWQLADLGRSVCKALTYRDFDKVERVFSVPNEGRSFLGVNSSSEDKFYELAFGSSPLPYGREASLTFKTSNCSQREVVKVACKDLECGLRPQISTQTSRIVGGGNASPGAWPWQAALYREGVYQCGATLISSTWLISAGHCFYENTDEWWVARLGTLRTSSSLPSPHEQIRHVAQVIVHPQYVDWEFINDIALLRLAESVHFTDHVRPICLPPVSSIVRNGAVCTVVGWGQLFEFGRVFPDTLQEVQVPVISTAECRKRTVFMPLYKITDDMFCAGYERGGRDACLGDSGGPLMCQENDGRWKLYGIISNGSGCARSNLPGVYTKVAKYHSWIMGKVLSEGNATGRGEAGDSCKGHRCPLGECLPKSRLCNGFVECSDGSDEKDCW